MESPRRTRHVLVIANTEDRALWKRLFSDLAPLSDNSVLSCVVSTWPELQLTSFASEDPGKRLQVQVKDEGVCFVEMVVVRKLCRGLDVAEDHRNKLFAMMHANVLCVNSAPSIYMCLDRIPCHAQLVAISDKHGHEKFPLISQSYYPSYRVGRFVPERPFVVKVGHAEAGYGKMVFANEGASWEDFVGCLALHGDHCECASFP
jgi:hypothetical protein